MRERLKHRRISASCKQSCEYSCELLVRRDRDSRAAGTTLVCHCRCSVVPGSMLLKAGDDADCAGGPGRVQHWFQTRGPGTSAGLRL